jgi:hypothetical protein
VNTASSSETGRFSVSIDNSASIEVDTYVNTSTVECGNLWSSPSLTNGLHTVSTLHSKCWWPTADALTHFMKPSGCNYFGGLQNRSKHLSFRTRWVYVSVQGSCRIRGTDRHGFTGSPNGSPTEDRKFATVPALPAMTGAVSRCLFLLYYL